MIYPFRLIKLETIFLFGKDEKEFSIRDSQCFRTLYSNTVQSTKVPRAALRKQQINCGMVISFQLLLHNEHLLFTLVLTHQNHCTDSCE